MENGGIGTLGDKIRLGPMGIEEVITLDMGLMDVWRSHVSNDKYFVSYP